MMCETKSSGRLTIAMDAQYANVEYTCAVRSRV